MKKLLFIALAIQLMNLNAFADTLTDASAGTLTVSDWKKIGNLWILEMIYTDTDGNGTTGIDIPVITTTQGVYLYNSFVSAYIELCETNPGATAPTDNYDITIKKKTSGLDVFQGELLNRDTSNTEGARPSYAYEHPDDTLQLVVENQSQAGAIVAIKLQIAP